MKKYLISLGPTLILPFKILQWQFYKWRKDKLRIVIGAGKTSFSGWFSTDKYFLDVTKKEDFERLLKKKRIDNILAEHVLEHLTDSQLDNMLQNFYKYTSMEAIIRIAVPDGFHKSRDYIDAVKPGGSGYGSDDHKHLFDYRSLSALFEKHGFSSTLLEYWDESKEFHASYVSDENGYIQRSFRNDRRNKDGNPNYTSLIIDFYKLIK